MNKKVASLLIALLLALMPVLVFANAAEPPNITVIVPNAPEDLSLTIVFAEGETREPFSVKSNSKAWETYYRFFGGGNFSGGDDLKGAVLSAKSGEKSFEIPLSETDAGERYNNYLTLDFQNESISGGVSPLRTGLLVAMRVGLTLVTEGAVFFLFGFREKKSWLLFLLLNLATQGMLNFTLSGQFSDSYWVIAYVVFELLIFIVEALFYLFLIKEKSKGRAVLCALAANAASLVLGGILLSYLPS